MGGTWRCGERVEGKDGEEGRWNEARQWGERDAEEREGWKAGRPVNEGVGKWRYCGRYGRWEVEGSREMKWKRC